MKISITKTLVGLFLCISVSLGIIIFDLNKRVRTLENKKPTLSQKEKALLTKFVDGQANFNKLVAKEINNIKRRSVKIWVY